MSNWETSDGLTSAARITPSTPLATSAANVSPRGCRPLARIARRRVPHRQCDDRRQRAKPYEARHLAAEAGASRGSETRHDERQRDDRRRRPALARRLRDRRRPSRANQRNVTTSQAADESRRRSAPLAHASRYRPECKSRAACRTKRSSARPLTAPGSTVLSIATRERIAASPSPTALRARGDRRSPSSVRSRKWPGRIARSAAPSRPARRSNGRAAERPDADDRERAEHGGHERGDPLDVCGPRRAVRHDDGRRGDGVEERRDRHELPARRRIGSSVTRHGQLRTWFSISRT